MLMSTQTNKTEPKYISKDRATIQAAMEEAEKRRENAPVINGKKYLSVKERVDIFRKFFGFDLTITTDVICPDPMVQRGSPVRAVAVVKDAVTGTILASGTALEYVGSSEYTRTSPYEVAETSAIGRALATLGLHGGEFASANEVEVAKATVTKSEEPVIEPDRMKKIVEEELATSNHISEVVALWESVRKQTRREDFPEQIAEEINDLFKAKVRFIREMEHREQQEKIDG